MKKKSVPVPSKKKSPAVAGGTPPAWTARLRKLRTEHERFLARRNPVDRNWDNGVFERFQHPAITYRHAPIEWRFDLNPKTNPFLMERLGVNATLNPGAFLWHGKVHMVVRFEGYDRKSLFAIAESPNGIDDWRFWDEPVDLPELKPETNVYDMRVTFHEDGWIYGVFCAEAKDPDAKPGDLSSAVAVAGVVRTRDFKKWVRLPNLKTPASQQRNVVLHPEFIGGQYALYTRPMDGFIDVGSGGGIGWTLCRDITTGVTGPETIIDGRAYHTIKEVKNGQGPAPIKTAQGWLHLAHGVRACAAGLRYAGRPLSRALRWRGLRRRLECDVHERMGAARRQSKNGPHLLWGFRHPLLCRPNHRWQARRLVPPYARGCADDAPRGRPAP
jgi:4-O-beta-D-mannosyl-D-glucose phosphorylase